MKRFQDAITSIDSTVHEALQHIEKGGLQIALVVDADQRLVGTLTDGDVRRFILQGKGLGKPVRDAMNASPRTLPVGAARYEAERMMTQYGINQVPLLDSAGRIAGVEAVDTLVQSDIPSTTIILMAGGKGVRLRPITEHTPKPLIKISGRPILETIIETLARQGFNDFYLAVNYKADLFAAHFGDGSAMGVSIRYLTEESSMGTAGALGLLLQRPTGPFVVMNADILSTIDMRSLLRFHNEQNAVATVALREYNFQVPYGVVEIDGDRIAGLVEKPMYRHFVSAGIYILAPEILDHVAPGTPIDMPDLLKAQMASNAKIAAYPLHEYWLDVGRMSDLERAQQEFSTFFGESV